MPSFRRVSFSDRDHYSRLPHDDELYVIKAFARHADRCESCFDPYQAYKDGSTLCPRGHERALDVAQYVYNKGGQAYSQVDRERNQRVQIEIPANCEAVRSLLKAMDRGLRVMRKHTPSSYDRSYYVPARLSVPDNHPSNPTTRPSTSTSTAKSTKSSNSAKSHLSGQPVIAPKQSSNPRSRPRAISASSISSVSSADAQSRPASRSTRGAWVRSRSKDGSKRSHSPIFIRPGTSSRSKSESKATQQSASHSRNNSNSSSSSSNSRTSSIFSFSGSRSRNRDRSVSISSQDSPDEQQHQAQSKHHTLSARKGSSAPKIAFRTPTYRNEDFEVIVPK